jgi:mycofactocin precursor
MTAALSIALALLFLAAAAGKLTGKTQATMSAAPDATPAATAEAEEPLVEDDRELVEDELLVEDVSIDGMCGVY